MSLQYQDPNDLEVDEQNERVTLDTEMEDGEFVDEDLEQLRQSIEQFGLAQPPMTRIETDGATETHKVVIGQRRVVAARAVEDVDEIPVVVMEWDDEEALKASITENIDLFRSKVSMQDRCTALQKLWEMMGGSGMPVQSHLAAELGVPRETVRTWLEPLHDGWKDTTLDPSTDEEPAEGVQELGERKLAEIRRMTDGGEEAERVAELVADAALTQEELEQVREHVEDDGWEVEEAIDYVSAGTEDVESEDSDSSGPISASVEFDTDTSVAIEEYANQNDTEPANVIVDAVQWFLESEGHL